MNLLKINNLKKTFGGNVLFEDISLNINSDDKVALIGRNGVGKTTLIKLILNEITPDSGEIFIFKQAKIGYLSQDIITSLDNTMYEECLSVFKEIIAIEENMNRAMRLLEEDHSEDALRRYSNIEHEFYIKGGYEYLTTIDMLLTKFGFTRDDYDRSVKTFSGGEKTRIAFAKLLMTKPDLLILDEPTNHMDIEIIEWLEDYLKKYAGAVLVVTHDKYFINKVVNKIYEIDYNKLELYHGNYDAYEIEKVERYERLMKSFIKQQKKIAHLQSFVDRFRYKESKAKSAQDRIKKISRIEKIDVPKTSQRHVNITFKSKRPTNSHILEINNLSIGYDNPLVENINFKMRGFEKIGIIGRNGTGKTTLIKTIMQELNPLKGKVNFLKKVKFGYFDQNLEKLDERLTVMDTIHNMYPTKTLYEVRSSLAKVMFSGEDVKKKVSVLSGGEKVKLSLLLLMLEQPELLILDEPTNHLDIDTKNIVEDVFEEYVGPIIFISHDRYFINKVATKIIHIDEFVKVYDGNYTSYMSQLEAEERKSSPKNLKHKKPPVIDPVKKLAKFEKQLQDKEMKLDILKQELFLKDVYMDKELFAEKSVQIKLLEADINTIYSEIEDLKID